MEQKLLERIHTLTHSKDEELFTLGCKLFWDNSPLYEDAKYCFELREKWDTDTCVNEWLDIQTGNALIFRRIPTTIESFLTKTYALMCSERWRANEYYFSTQITINRVIWKDTS